MDFIGRAETRLRSAREDRAAAKAARDAAYAVPLDLPGWLKLREAADAVYAAALDRVRHARETRDDERNAVGFRVESE